MGVIKFIIYFLAANAIELTGESVEMTVTDTLLKVPTSTSTSPPFTESVIKNSSLGTILKQPTNFIDGNSSETRPHPLSELYRVPIPNTLNGTVKATNNYNGEMKTRSATTVMAKAYNGTNSYENVDGNDKGTKNQTIRTISESDSRVITQTVNFAANMVPDPVHDSPENRQQQQEQHQQLKTVASINKQKILLTDSSASEQLNNHITTSESLTNNRNVHQSVSNSIIITTTDVPHDKLSIVDSTKKPETLRKPIKALRSGAKGGTTLNYITRAPYDEGSIEKIESSSPSQMLSTSHEYNNASIAGLLAARNAFEFKDLPNVKNNRPNGTTIHTQWDDFVHTMNPSPDGEMNVAVDGSYGLGMRAQHNSTNSKPGRLIKTGSPSGAIDSDDIPIILNHNEMHASVTLHSMPTDETENHQTEPNIEHISQIMQTTTTNHLITVNENQQDRMAKNYNEKANDVNLVDNRIFVFGSANESMNVNMAPDVENNVPTYFKMQSVRSWYTGKQNRDKDDTDVHDSSSKNEAEPPTSQVYHNIRSNRSTVSRNTLNGSNTISTTIRPIGINDHFFNTLGSGAKNHLEGNGNLSQPLEIINSSTSSKLTMSSLFADEPNNKDHNSENMDTTHSSAMQSTLNNIQEQFIGSQNSKIRSSNINTESSITSNLSTIFPSTRHALNVETDSHDLHMLSSISSPDGILKLLANGSTDEVLAVTSGSTSHDHSLYSDYVNNFLTAAITVEHGASNQLGIDYTNGTKSDRCETLIDSSNQFG